MLSDEGVALHGRLLCRLCYGHTQSELDRRTEAKLRSVFLPGALIGAVLGSLIGAGFWWLAAERFGVQSGLVAALIGFLSARGAILGGGSGRSGVARGLVLVASVLSYLAAWQMLLASRLGQPISRPDPQLMPLHLTAHFQVWDGLFLACVLIAAFQSYRLPRVIGR